MNYELCQQELIEGTGRSVDVTLSEFILSRAEGTGCSAALLS